MERLVLRDELSPRRAQGQDGGLQPPRGQDCLFLINLHPNDDKPKLFFSLCASVFCLDCDHRWGLCYHHYLQVAISFFHTHLWNFKGRGMARCCWVPATDVSRLAPEDPAGLPELNNDANNNNTGQYLMST